MFCMFPRHKKKDYKQLGKMSLVEREGEKKVLCLHYKKVWSLKQKFN